jgi:hypothetical protein
MCKKSKIIFLSNASCSFYLIALWKCLSVQNVINSFMETGTIVKYLASSFNHFFHVKAVLRSGIERGQT